MDDEALGLTTSPVLALAVTAACPVVLVPDDPSRAAGPMPRSVRDLLGVDARRPSDAAVDFAFDAARVRDARMHAVHAWELPSEAAELPFAIPEEDRAAREDHEVQLLTDALRP
ncbi:universal stress protein [Streptomyces sp. NPDC050448]|uniref:universal stress protein n=1 Tax=Streptomyces sp. NPDC050448 TaxID=3155404 RepID=UPI003440CD7E